MEPMTNKELLKFAVLVLVLSCAVMAIRAIMWITVLNIVL